MTDTLFIFTFGPVQSYIAEARRGQDLWAGSHILSQLARAALMGLEKAGATLIYPTLDALRNKNAGIPNKLVVRLNGQDAKVVGDAATNTLNEEWRKIGVSARQKAEKWTPKPDETWQKIWDRQTNACWECHWAAMPIAGDYGMAYRSVNTLLDAAKRARLFEQCHEDGSKDSLSGRRSALRTHSKGTDADAREYWRAIARNVGRTDLRPDGREMLDALGLIKRFWKDKPVASVSSIAANEFLQRAASCPKELSEHRIAVERLLEAKAIRVRDDYEVWPYDGDLFFQETLMAERLEDSYGVVGIDKSLLKHAQVTLAALHEKAEGAPSPYYAILMLDGDSIGEHVDNLKHAEEHSTFSEKINAFAGGVNSVVKSALGELIYAGGDDVLALLPLNGSINAARKLVQRFKDTGKTASAGIAIVHHLSPLSMALQDARAAEGFAKGVAGKDAVGIHISKRSGEVMQARCKWDDLDAFNAIVEAIREEHLSSKLSYDLRYAARAFDKADDAFKAEIKRLIKRHKMPPKKEASTSWDETSLTQQCQNWADALGAPEVFADWMLFARFVAAGGAE